MICSTSIGACRKTRCHAPPFGPVIRCSNFTFKISQTNNGYSLLFLYFNQAFAFRHKLQKYFCFVHSNCTHCMPFLIKKGAKMSILHVKFVKMRWRLGATFPDPHDFRQLGVSTPDPPIMLPSLCQILSAPLSRRNRFKQCLASN